MTRFNGSICFKHPEGEGLRLISNGHCILCQRERRKDRRQTESGKAAEQEQNAARMRDYRAEGKYKSNRRIHIGRQQPAWADTAKIAEIYRKAKELGLTVDHEIPLRGELVSGLHVHNNLQLLPGHENMSKGNKYAPL